MSLEMTFSITHTSFPTRAIFSPASLFYRTSDLLTIKILRSKGCVMAQQKKEFLTDEAVEEEIARLRQSPYVKLAQKEERIASNKTLIIRGGLVLSGDAALVFLDAAHPIGSILETVRQDDPGEYLGGTWVEIEDTGTTVKWRRTD